MFPLKHVCVLLFGMAASAFSQSRDSIAQAINAAPNDSNKVKQLLKLSSSLQGNNVPKAIAFAEHAVELSKKLDLPRLSVKAINHAGHLYDYVNYSEKAIVYHQQALAICEKHKLVKELGDTYNWLGGVFYNKHNYDFAGHYWLIALKLRQQTGNKTGIAGSLNNIGEVYRLKGNIDSAFVYYRKAIKMNEVLDDKLFLSINYSNIGFLYQSQKNYAEALNSFSIALNYAQEINNPEQLALVNNSLGNYFLETGDDKEAYNYYIRGLNFATSCGSMVERSAAYKGLAGACRNLKLPDEAFDFLLRHIKLNDTLNNLEKNRQVLDIGVRYETEQKERELQQLKAQQSISELAEKNRQVVIYILVIGLGFVLILALLLYKNNRSRLKLNTQLNDRLDEINKSIAYAQKIQHTLLANEQFITQTLPQHFIFYKSKDIVSGDFYWATSAGSSELGVRSNLHSELLTPNSELFYLAVCDSTGHGVPGAFMSLLNIGFLAEAIKEKDILETGEVFNYVRDRLIAVLGTEGQKDGFDGILLRFDRTKRKITYSAAHNAPILIYNDILTELPHDKMPVGIGERKEKFQTFDLDWIPGATLYLFTDGYADQFGGAKGKKFKYNQLYNLLLANSHKPLPEQKTVLEQTFEDWRGNLEQVDDVCIVGVRL